MVLVGGLSEWAVSGCNYGEEDAAALVFAHSDKSSIHPTRIVGLLASL